MTTTRTTLKDDSSSEAPVDLDMLRTRLEVSVGMTRTLVSSWLPPDDNDKDAGSLTTSTQQQFTNKTANRKENEQTVIGGMTARPPRLGLGAKYLSHKQAMQSNGHSNAKGILTEDKLRRKLTGGHLSKSSTLTANKSSKTTTKSNNNNNNDDDDDDDDDESKFKSSNLKNTNNSKRAIVNGSNDVLSFYLGNKKRKKQTKGNKS
ncbi:hypothetical protein BDF19DRAFT_465715 [Syncephalis fuscata]|nr:hypothetical protein BDF19DRAFT_465715 [Syncephalis fuscata]